MGGVRVSSLERRKGKLPVFAGDLPLFHRRSRSMCVCVCHDVELITVPVRSFVRFSKDGVSEHPSCFRNIIFYKYL